LFAAGQLAEHAAVATLDGLKLQDWMVYTETVEKLVPNLFGKGFGAAQELIGHFHVTGKGDAGGTHIPCVQVMDAAYSWDFL